MIDESVQRIDAGTELADKSGEVLTGISNSIKDVAAMIEAISAASKEQTTGIQQVNMSIADIDRVTQENAALVEETTSAANVLNQEAGKLTSNMSFFKTGQAYHSASITPICKAEDRRGIKVLPLTKAHRNTDEWSEF